LSQFPSLHPVLRAKANDVNKKLKTI